MIDQKERQRIYDDATRQPEKEIARVLLFQVILFLVYTFLFLRFGGVYGAMEIFVAAALQIALCLLLTIYFAFGKNIRRSFIYLASGFIVLILECGTCGVLNH